MKIAIIGTVGLPAKYGGWETLTDHLTDHLSGSFDITVYCSGKKYAEQPATYKGVKLKYVNLDANGVQSIPYDIVSMLSALRYADVLLILGVSGCIFLPVIKLLSRKKVIVNIDGMEWRRAKWGRFAKWFLKLSEATAVRFADVTVADNQAIRQYISAQYGRPSALIAYGGDHVTQQPVSADAALRFSFLQQAYAFKVCRIEPENNVHMIIDVFASQSRMPLVIVGNWDNSAYGQQLKQQYAQVPHIHLLDPIYDQTLLNELRSNCRVYVHGHSAGGTNPSLVEAMYLGLPIIAYGVSYNRETTHEQARYFDDHASLQAVLEGVQPDELEAIGRRMKQVAEENYTWAAISEKYAALFTAPR